MRPDFLYNYISLAPSYDEANRVFDVMFPSLLGVTISHHIPYDVSTAVHDAIKDHGKRDPARVRAMLRTLGERLKSQGPPSKDELKHFLESTLGGK